jgi:cytochrome c peroxidase
MGAKWAEAVGRLAGEADYRTRFSKLFSDGITAANVKAAIAAFERTLLTPNSRFDRWLKGDAGALTAAELRGYELFKQVGCIACHQGRNVGGNMFQRFGVMGDYFRDRGEVKKADWGRFNVTGEEVDRFVFKVPSLRNIEHTAPYFHDGSAKTLPDAVRTMARYQLGRQLPDADIESLVAFLKTLSGELPERYRKPVP